MVAYASTVKKIEAKYGIANLYTSAYLGITGAMFSCPTATFVVGKKNHYS